MSVEPAGGTISGNNPNVITDQQLFDHATSDPTPAPATSPPPSGPGPSPSPSGDPSSAPASTRPDLQQPAQPQGQPRDEGGRFAPRPQGQQAQPQQEHRVPLRELMEERDRRQRLEAHTQELTRVVMALQQQMLPQQHPQQQPQGPETIFDHPEQYLDQRVVTPLRQEGQMYMMQIKDGLSREMANTQFGAEEVNAGRGSRSRHGRVHGVRRCQPRARSRCMQFRRPVDGDAHLHCKRREPSRHRGGCCGHQMND